MCISFFFMWSFAFHFCILTLNIWMVIVWTVFRWIDKNFTVCDFSLCVLATNLPRCHQGDTNCVANIINTYVRTLKDGRRDINMVSIDPLRVDEVDIIQGSDSPVNVNLNFKDVLFYGLSTLDVKKVVWVEP